MRRFAACPWLAAHTPSGAAMELRVATGFTRRLLGLAGLRSLDAGHGLAIPRCTSVHTIGMRFAIDVVFLDWPPAQARATVLDLRERLMPWRFARTRAVALGRHPVCAVELSAGQSRRLGLVPGARAATGTAVLLRVPLLLARPASGQLPERPSRSAVGGGPHDGEDQALKRG